jgi:hypothetical protein
MNHPADAPTPVDDSVTDEVERRPTTVSLGAGDPT